jgi:hypothetical protein
MEGRGQCIPIINRMTGDTPTRRGGQAKRRKRTTDRRHRKVKDTLQMVIKRLRVGGATYHKKGNAKQFVISAGRKQLSSTCYASGSFVLQLYEQRCRIKMTFRDDFPSNPQCERFEEHEEDRKKKRN